ncbi:MAG: DUF1365 family protein [Pseudomonadota bacterium]
MTRLKANTTHSCLYVGKVVHTRLKPVHHKLSYRVFSMLLDLDEVDSLSKKLKWFSRGQFNLFSFHDKDYGDGDPSDLAAYIRGVLTSHKIDGEGPLQLLCYPRMLGYAFNPIAVYYCHDKAGRPSAMLYEVSSTFGERHSYLIPLSADGNAQAHNIRQHTADKKLHVSPFMEMDMRYRFNVNVPDEKLSLTIYEEDREGPILNASFSGMREALDDKTLLRTFMKYPLMTLKVIGGIHIEAIKLLLKGMRLVKGPKAPRNPVTLVSDLS